MEQRDEQNFAESMHRLREERGWSQAELARRMVDAGWPTYSQMTVSRTEKKERPIRLGEAIALARIFGVELILMTSGFDAAEVAMAYLREARSKLLKARDSAAAARVAGEEALAFSERLWQGVDPSSEQAEWIRTLEGDVMRLLGEVEADDGEH